MLVWIYLQLERLHPVLFRNLPQIHNRLGNRYQHSIQPTALKLYQLIVQFDPTGKKLVAVDGCSFQDSKEVFSIVTDALPSRNRAIILKGNYCIRRWVG